MKEEEYNHLHALAEMIIYGYLDNEIMSENLFITLDARHHKGMTDFMIYL